MDYNKTGSRFEYEEEDNNNDDDDTGGDDSDESISETFHNNGITPDDLIIL